MRVAFTLVLKDKKNLEKGEAISGERAERRHIGVKKQGLFWGKLSGGTPQEHSVQARNTMGKRVYDRLPDTNSDKYAELGLQVLEGC